MEFQTCIRKPKRFLLSVRRVKAFDKRWVAEQETEILYFVQRFLECLEGVNGEVSGYDGEDGTVFDLLF